MDLLEKVSTNCYRVVRQGAMKAEARVYLNPTLFREFREDQALKQLMDAAALPGVQDPVIGMPDIHSGFGLPIGGVLAVDAEHGVVSAGAVGMDINCGVRLLSTNLEASDLDKPKLRGLIKAIAKRVPSGIGRAGKNASLIKAHFRDYVVKGAPFLLEQGFGRPEDINCIEEGGCLPGAEISSLSREAVQRGDQLSTIGGGNHFIELGYVHSIYDQEMSRRLKLNAGSLTVLIHTGSRGFGHQICTDYTASMRKAAAAMKLEIPSPGLAAAPIQSEEGKRYLKAMACAVNFAFCNRQWITDDIRHAFSEVLGGKSNDYGLDLVYDLAHNIAKFEQIGPRKLLIHRKGATRALPAGHSDNPAVYRDCGHPILIPGSMGTASFVIRARPPVEKTYYSVNHGAGRVLSRKAARRDIQPAQLQEALGDVLVMGRNLNAYLEEAPQAYKDIRAVVDTFTEIGFTGKIACLMPLAVIKGEGDE